MITGAHILLYTPEAEALRGRFDPAPPLAEIGTALQRLAAAAAFEPNDAPGRRKANFRG